MRARATLVAFAVATATGCGLDAGGHASPTVGRVALQNDITQRLDEAGQTPQSVTCQGDLVGEVGRTAHCDVVMSDVNSFAPIVTVTSVDGDRVDYELTPALSQAQLEQAVARLVLEKSPGPVDSVACESGLIGTVGTVVHCDVDAAGVQARRAVKVTEVSGLTLNFILLSN
jgi:hypothetical protein